MKLTLDLIPSSSFYDNVRSNVSQMEWDVIRKKCYEKAGHKCEICGSDGTKQGFRHKVECHEKWSFDEAKGIQTLIGFISLCPMCHKCKHYGLADLRGETDKVNKHLLKINKVSAKEMEKHIEASFVEWNRRSQQPWNVDISYIETYMLDDFNAFMRKF